MKEKENIQQVFERNIMNENKFEKLQERSSITYVSPTNDPTKQKLSTNSPRILKAPPKLPNYQLSKQNYNSPKSFSPTNQNDSSPKFPDQSKSQQQIKSNLDYQQISINKRKIRLENDANNNSMSVNDTYDEFGESEDDNEDNEDKEDNEENNNDEEEEVNFNKVDSMQLQTDYSILSPIPEENIDSNSLSQATEIISLSQSQIEQSQSREISNSSPEMPQGDDSCEIIQDFILKVEELLESGNHLFEKVNEIIDNSTLEIQAQKYR